MTEFESFRQAVLENNDLQEEVFSIVDTAMSNGAGVGEGLAAIAKVYGYDVTAKEIYVQTNLLGAWWRARF
ncbi:MAG: Nif11-like leader peptide family natural product precursor [Burkholderiales bacterium]|nr:Nif11-like leader peptide family natural product precursor [Burkholderiales bacterium]